MKSVKSSKAFNTKYTKDTKIHKEKLNIFPAP